MELKDIEDFKNKFDADLFFNTDIKKFNWFNIGGKSKILHLEVKFLLLWVLDL